MRNHWKSHKLQANMNLCENNNNTALGGTQSTRFEAATRHLDSGESGLTQGKSEFSGKLPRKKPTYIGTFNINTLIQPGKLHHLVMELNKQKY